VICPLQKLSLSKKSSLVELDTVALSGLGALKISWSTKVSNEFLCMTTTREIRCFPTAGLAAQLSTLLLLDQAEELSGKILAFSFER
jgi:hypothetical protein